MNRPIYFCKSWFWARKRPTKVWNEAQARAAHEARQLYTVLVDSPDEPYCVIEVTAKFVGVTFLDRSLRQRLTYQFQEVEPGRLFLSMATDREFDDDSDKVSQGTSYIFSESGDVKIRRRLFRPDKLETAINTTDVSANYASMPAFGEYDDLIRVERT